MTQIRPQISVTMIVKNEEDMLTDCLSSVKEVADELVITDTGSTDKTIEIAKSFAAKISNFEWTNDFAAARNFALSQATGEWIFQMDADEVLEPDSSDKLRALIKASQADAFNLYIRDTSRDDVFPQLRLFRNDSTFRYESAVHNQILRTPPLTKDQVGYADIYIDHFGYTDDVRAKKNKFERNISMLEECLRSEPDSHLYLYSLANEYYANKDLGKALDVFRQLETTGKPLEADAVRDYADTLGKTGHFEEALLLLSKQISRFPEHPDLHLLAGMSFLSLGRLEQAKAAFNTCLELKGTGLPYRVWRGSASNLAYNGLALAMLKEKQYRNGLHFLEQSLAASPSDTFAARQLAAVQRALDGPSAAAERLKAIADTTCSEIQTIISELEKQSG